MPKSRITDAELAELHSLIVEQTEARMQLALVEQKMQKLALSLTRTYKKSVDIQTGEYEA